MTGKLIKTAKNTVCQVALGLGICVNDAHSTMIFQSVGVFGEPVFSQIAPIGKPSTAIKVHYFSVPKIIKIHKPAIILKPTLTP